MNSQYLAQSSRSLNLGCQSGRRAGITRSHNGPSLHKTINASPTISRDNMSSKVGSKQSAWKKSPAKADPDEDLSRSPEGSSDSDDDSADLKQSSFISGSAKMQTTSLGWQARRDAGRQAPPNMGRGTLKKKSELSKSIGQTKPREGHGTPISSQTSSNSSKRKNEDEELDSSSLGRGMGDSFGRVNKGKKPKTTFGKSKSVKAESAGFKIPLSDHDDDETPELKFIKPESNDTPKRSGSGGFIMPSQDTPRRSAGSTFRKPDGCNPAAAKRSVSPMEMESQFIIPEIDFDEPSNPQSSNSDISLPNLPEATATTTAIDSSQTIDAMLQANELGLDQAAVEDARKIVAAGAGVATTRQSDVDDFDDDYFLTMTQKARCPMCNQPVDPDDLRAFGYMNIKKQETFCRSHQTKTAEQDWKDNDYPAIEWTELDSRIAKHHSFIKKLINGEDSHYRSLLSDRVDAGQDRTTLTMKTNLTPGYYGTRGLRIISENIMQKFTPLLKKRMVQDRLMSSRGFAPYVQAVLVPEVAVRLIMEDMKVDMEEARDILTDSAVVGELLNEEIRDVVRKKVEDSDESDG